MSHWKEWVNIEWRSRVCCACLVQRVTTYKILQDIQRKIMLEESRIDSTKQIDADEEILLENVDAVQWRLAS